MARIVLVIEDTVDEKGYERVKVSVEPSVHALMGMAKEGKLTNAHGYAFLAMNAIRKENEKNEPKKKIIIPRARLN